MVNGKGKFRSLVLLQYFKNQTYSFIMFLGPEEAPVRSFQDYECVENSRST